MSHLRYIFTSQEVIGHSWGTTVPFNETSPRHTYKAMTHNYINAVHEQTRFEYDYGHLTTTLKCQTIKNISVLSVFS